MARDAIGRSSRYTASYQAEPVHACTPRSSPETGHLQSTSLGEHVKSRHVVQGTPRTKSPCVLTHVEAVFS
jgi:hypothetical protein